MRPRRFVRQLDSLRTQRLAWQSEVIRAPAPSCDKRELLSLLRDPLIDQEHRSIWLPARRCSATKASTPSIAAKLGAVHRKNHCLPQSPLPPNQSMARKYAILQQI